MGHNLRPVRRLLVVLASTAAMAVGLTACEPSLEISTTPGLFPGFSTTVPDYVTRCQPGDPVEVSVNAPQGTTVSVDGGNFRSGNFSVDVNLSPGQRFTIAVDSSSTTTHSIRCLPTDFPQFLASRPGTPQSQYYLTSLNNMFPNANHYSVIFDTNGVPVWWIPRRPTLFPTVLRDHVVWMRGPFGAGGAVELNLDGSVVRNLNTVGAPSDFHDIIRLPNGNYAMVTLTDKPNVDLRPVGGPANATIIDHVVQELTPSGQLVWSWKTSNHIPLTEWAATWRDEPPDFAGRYDPYHWNSIEWTGDGFILSYRHLDALIKVDKATKDIVWKFGGVPRPESLDVFGDPVFTNGTGFSGQHDARLQPDGTLTVYDNGSRKGRLPRGVRYEIDEAAGTATLVQLFGDPDVGQSGCCGSTRRLPGGNWVTGWGGGPPIITENRPNGQRVFQLFLPSGFNVYRAVPIAFGTFTRAELRAGMDAQYPRSK